MKKILLFNSAFTPPTANLVGHWDSSNAASITSSGGAVSQWSDLSGLGNHFVQATPSKKPTYSGTGLASLILFDGVANLLTAAISYTMPFTCYMVSEIITFTANAQICDFGNTSYGGGVQFDVFPNVFLDGIGPGNINPLALSTFQVMTIVGNGGLSSVSINNGTFQIFGGSMASLTGGGLNIGGRSGGGFYSKTGFKEIYLYNTNHSTTSQSALQISMISYLRSKWGI
jgi:hypothetical protein